MSTSSTNEPNNRKGLKKNFFIISITLILVYTSFDGVTNLQSSLNIDQNIGLYSMAIIAACCVLSYIFITNPMIYFLGYKWTIFLSQIGFALFIAANIYPKAWLMFPASVICGLLKAGFWTAHSAYVADLGKKNGHGNSDAKVNKYFGLFFASEQMTQIWGNLIAYLVLRTLQNTSIQNNTNLCGANYWSSELNSTKNQDGQISIQTSAILFGIFIGLIIISLILVALFLDQKQHIKKSESHGLVKDTIKYIGETLKQLKKLQQILVLAIPFYMGTIGAFIFGIFTNSFVTCTIGIEYIGLVMMTYGISATIFNIIVAYLGKYKCPSLLLSISALIFYAVLITLLLWQPHSSQTYVLYILAGLFGIAQAIWEPVQAGLYEHLFTDNEEAAFSCMWLGQNVGFLVVYIYAKSLRVRISIILQIIYLTIALIGYFILKIIRFCKKQKNSSGTSVEVPIDDN